MVIMEMKEAAQERAFDLVEELHELGHQKKVILNELEDVLCDCFDKDDDKEESEEGKDLGFKDKYNRHYAMRNFDKEDDEDSMHRAYRRRQMRMRRNRVLS